MSHLQNEPSDNTVKNLSILVHSENELAGL